MTDPKNRFWVFDWAALLICFPVLVVAYAVYICLSMAGSYRE